VLRSGRVRGRAIVLSVIHVHVDADDLWIYAEAYGIASSDVAGSVYADALPRFLELLAESGARATIFVVGRDLSRPEARAFCRDAVAAGHEIANHTYSHPIALHRLSRNEKEREILDAHGAIAEVTGIEPVGFRGPGYYLDGDIVDVLVRNGYSYDTSILPSYLQLLMKPYIRVSAGRSIDKQFGTPRSPFASQRLRRIAVDGASSGFLYELPVSVLPLLRLPIHSTFSFHLPDRVRRLLNATYGRRGEAVMLFHAVDAVDGVSSVDLSRRVPALRLPTERRLALIREALTTTRGRAPMTTAERVRGLEPARVPRSRVLTFAQSR
jgi:hypothetical protein